jgi:hypothetical protein
MGDLCYYNEGRLSFLDIPAMLSYGELTPGITVVRRGTGEPLIIEESCSAIFIML